jgi:hypothetical protein
MVVAVSEIILVDDASEAGHLGAPLEAAVARLDVPVLIVRSTQRIGLIKARLRHSTALETMLQGETVSGGR